MHGQPIADSSIEDGHHDSIVLDLLLVEHDGLWSISELKRLVGDPPGVDDAIARLHALGLIHKLDEYVFASRAAAHVHKLAS